MDRIEGLARTDLREWHEGSRGPTLDEDLDALTRDALLVEARRLRAGIRAHRDSTGHDLCWHHPRLWGMLPEAIDPAIEVPDWPQFLRGCIRYRESLERQAPDAPRSAREHEAISATMLWRRIDAPGHDAAQLTRTNNGFEIAGAAVFRHEGGPAMLRYRLEGDASWSTRRARVSGFLGREAVRVEIERTPSGWTFNGHDVDVARSCTHLDLSFTPATNVPHFRQLDLRVGERSDLPVAWLDLPLTRIQELPQRYERRGPTTYWYEAPTVGYAALLETTPFGFVRSYPKLWSAEADRSPQGEPALLS